MGEATTFCRWNVEMGTKLDDCDATIANQSTKDSGSIMLTIIDTIQVVSVGPVWKSEQLLNKDETRRDVEER